MKLDAMTSDTAPKKNPLHGLAQLASVGNRWLDEITGAGQHDVPRGTACRRRGRFMPPPVTVEQPKIHAARRGERRAEMDDVISDSGEGPQQRGGVECDA